MELLAQIGAWVVVIVLAGFGVVLGVREDLRARARRRSVVAGKEVRYGAGKSYRPRAALWIGLAFAWLAVNTATMLVIAGLSRPPWPTIVIGALLGVTAFAAAGACWFLLDQARTELVEGRVLERKILYSGEDNDTKNYWIAVDDGRPGRIAGTPVSPRDYARVVAGALVRLHLTPRGRQVKRLDVVELPESVNATGPSDDLWVTPAQAARALGSPVEVVPVASETPNTRCYTYVPPGHRVINGTTLPPALHVTEAFDPEAANEVARRATAGGRRTWHHGNKGVFQTGMTYLLTWGSGALLIRGQVDVADVGPVSRLAHSLKPPPARRG